MKIKRKRNEEKDIKDERESGGIDKRGREGRKEGRVEEGKGEEKEREEGGVRKIGEEKEEKCFGVRREGIGR